MKNPASQGEDRALLPGQPQSSPWPPEMCKSVIESSPWPMFVLDCELHTVIEANDAAVAKYGFSREVILERGIQEIIPPEYQKDLFRMLDDGLAGPIREYVSEHWLSDGTRVPVEIISFPLLWNGRPARFSMIRDAIQGISPNAARRREPDVEPALASVPAAAAHDFNNLLTVILAVAEQMQEGQGDPEQQASLLARIVHSAQELAHRRLAQDNRLQSHRLQIQLNHVLREQEEMLAAVLGKEIHLEMDLDNSLWPVFAEASPWREAILNLAMNARDAMPNGGQFYLSTSRATFDSDDKELNLPRGRYAHLVVRDTGIGMSAETQQQAFEPYYSTKSRTKNSGLGLSSVQQVVKQCSGGIRLTSAPGEGTRFDIFIPAQENIQTVAPENNSHGGFILLVEDNDELRMLIRDFLTLRGYDVLACAGAEVALGQAASLHRSLDLIISDVLLPGLSGEQLVEHLQRQHPQARVIFMSGDKNVLSLNSAPDSTAGTAAESTISLQKPFSLQQLAAAVTHLLSGTRSGPA
jgi:two-component system, cell cycle sensor histidine kinase and response regulator CckA